MVPQKAIWYSINSNGPVRPQSPGSHTSNIAPARLAERVWCTKFASLGSNPRFYLLTSATGRIGVHTAPKYGTKPIRYVILHFRDRRGATSLRRRNRAAITVLVCEQTP